MWKVALMVAVCGVGTIAVAQAPEAATSQPAMTQPAKLPAEVRAAQENLTKWVNSLYGKTEAEIVAELGEPMARDKDSDGDLVMKYMTAEKGKLNLYFSKRKRVVLASYGVMSE